MRITNLSLRKVVQSGSLELFEIMIRDAGGSWHPAPDLPPMSEDRARQVLRGHRASDERVTSLLTVARDHFAHRLGRTG
jgi:hypothetical protein